MKKILITFRQKNGFLTPLCNKNMDHFKNVLGSQVVELEKVQAPTWIVVGSLS